MDRDLVEIKLLSMRQRYFDTFQQARRNKVIPLFEVNNLKVHLDACNEILSLYRTHKHKGTKNAETRRVY